MRKFVEAPGSQIEDVDDIPSEALRAAARCVAVNVACLDDEGHVVNPAEVRETLALLGLAEALLPKVAL